MMSQTNESRLWEMLQTALGPELGRYLQAEGVTEIMANPDGSVWIEKQGEGVLPTGVSLPATQVERIIQLVASSIGSVCNANSPSLSAVLPASGARFQGFLGDIVPNPAFVIRRRAESIYTLQDYVNQGTMTVEQAQTIHQAVLDRMNILIVGGTGTGKTTLANAILQVIGQTGHRVVTIEDTPELQCPAPNHFAFYIRDDVGFTWQKAVKDCLRIRPDRIVVGEVRDGSALDLLKAWNTGHNGGAATIHANSAEQGLTRLESLIEEVMPRAPKELIGEAIDLVVHIRRTNEGRVVDEVRSLSKWDTKYIWNS